MDTKTLYFNARSRNDEIRIAFPGGSVAVARCSDGTYWAHIGREHEGHCPPSEVGKFIAGRMDSDSTTEPSPIDILDPDLYHVAIRIGMAVQS